MVDTSQRANLTVELCTELLSQGYLPTPPKKKIVIPKLQIPVRPDSLVDLKTGLPRSLSTGSVAFPEEQEARASTVALPGSRKTKLIPINLARPSTAEVVSTIGLLKLDMSTPQKPTRPRRKSFDDVEKPLGSTKRLPLSGLLDATQELLKSLDQAIAERNPVRLQEHIDHSKLAGLRHEKVAAAQKLLQQLQAERVLKQAVDSRCCTGLKSALQQAQLAGISNEQVAPAAQLYKKLEAAHLLSEALTQGGSGAIRLAFQVAVHSGVDDTDLLREATKALQEIEKRYNRSSAPKGNSLSPQAADANMLQSDARLVASKLDCCLDSLNGAIASGETGALRLAIQEAVPFYNIGHEQVVERVKEAQQSLGATEAVRLLHAAEKAKTTDIAKLRDAIEKAEKFAVEGSLVDACRNRLHQHAAGEALSQAMAKRDASLLQAALFCAEEVGFTDKLKMAKAEKVMMQAQAREMLLQTTEGCGDTQADSPSVVFATAKATDSSKINIIQAKYRSRPMQKSSSLPQIGR